MVRRQLVGGQEPHRLDRRENKNVEKTSTQQVEGKVNDGSMHLWKIKVVHWGFHEIMMFSGTPTVN